MFIAKQVLNDSIQQVKASVTGQSNKKNINWDDFNYPPLLNVIHYNIDDAEPDQRTTVRFLHLTHVFIFIESILNIINNIALVSVGYSKGINIFYSFLFFFSFNPLAGFVFYRGYKGLCSDAFLLTLYKWTQFLLIIFWLMFSIVSFLGFNGFMAIGEYFNDGYIFEGVLAIIESVLFLLASLMSMFALFNVFQQKSQ